MLTACRDDVVSSPSARPSAATPRTNAVSATDAAAVALLAAMDQTNASLQARGADYRVVMAEYITDGNGIREGSVVIANDRGNKRIPADFVPFDPRRAPWSGPVNGATDDITFAIDETEDAVPPFGGLTAAQTTQAITNAMATWNNVACSTIPLTANPSFGLDLGIMAFLEGLGGSPFVVADIMHAGWRDLDFEPGVLAVTFTFAFISGGEPTDIDNDKRIDVAFSEIYYDPSYAWHTDGRDVDVESVALHESGHGLSQAHFGRLIFLPGPPPSIKASPRAVMNAFYGGPLRTLLGTDNGGHCTNWASWPSR